ncbi:hypothetical protein [Comamonas sp. UBA7528]|uniref:hypothetical protein n=1 Tax=Comamonas sp. UBA7528 TaxID=1946391 RepID=UPI0025C6F487|nr:hypothetical protein [Comamonas sp. UBA7528]
MLTINDLRVSDTAELHLKDAAGAPMFYLPAGGDPEKDKKPVLVELYGPGSDQYRQAQHAAQRRVMHLAKSGRKSLADRTVDELKADAAKLLVTLTVRFDGLDLQGRPMPEVLQALYADPSVGYITEQIDSFCAAWANFSPSALQS